MILLGSKYLIICICWSFSNEDLIVDRLIVSQSKGPSIVGNANLLSGGIPDRSHVEECDVGIGDNLLAIWLLPSHSLQLGTCFVDFGVLVLELDGLVDDALDPDLVVLDPGEPAREAPATVDTSGHDADESGAVSLVLLRERTARVPFAGTSALWQYF